MNVLIEIEGVDSQANILAIETVSVPVESVPSLKRFLREYDRPFPMALLVRMFVMHWNIGVDLSADQPARICD